MPLIRKPADLATPPPAPDLEAAKAALRSPDVDMRWRAARALSAFPEAAGALGEASAAEPNARVREAMFTSLALIGTAECTAVLVLHLRSDDAERRTGAMDSLRTLPRALGATLPGLLRDKDPDVRLLACDLVREMPSAEATVLLTAVLDRDPEINVCAAAVDVLAEVGAPAALPALHRCAERFADPFLSFAIKIACDRLGEQALFRG
ncbi:MAG TPA: HEAT repeat domain-containing protein [Caulobacteraceae bacterium]|nr:HEAT repeat domain-containing protein [Caulobacteraceae bacterium]